MNISLKPIFKSALHLFSKKLAATIVLTVLIEAITLLFRFGLGLESTVHTASTVGKLTFGLRIHHGYIGALILIILRLPRFRHTEFHSALTVLGASLIFSDIIHHTILYFVTGSADFDLVYPRT